MTIIQRALDRAAYHVACDEEANLHYAQGPSPLHWIARVWVGGFIYGLTHTC